MELVCVPSCEFQPANLSCKLFRPCWPKRRSLSDTDKQKIPMPQIHSLFHPQYYIIMHIGIYIIATPLKCLPFWFARMVLSQVIWMQESKQNGWPMHTDKGKIFPRLGNSLENEEAFQFILLVVSNAIPHIGIDGYSRLHWIWIIQSVSFMVYKCEDTTMYRTNCAHGNEQYCIWAL